MAFSKDLPPKSKLTKQYSKIPLVNVGTEFDDLRECSSSYKKAFLDAWKVGEALDILQLAI